MSISLSLKLITVSAIILLKQNKHNFIGLSNTYNQCYHYIVVGAGSAGCVVANRLSANPNIIVLLLEAGGVQTIATDIPGVSADYTNTEVDWNYTTVPQRDFGLAYDGILTEPRGKIIGGTSSINGMNYNRGNRRDFDNWVTTYGSIGWSYAEVLPYFIKSENNSDLNIVRHNQGFHGTGGPVRISTNSMSQPVVLQSMRAFNELGFKTVDINGAKQLGTAITQQFVDSRTGMRSSTANAYIDPNPHPNNLHILTNAFVVKILISKTNNGLKAFGVQFIKDNELHEVRAEKEVIISAGAINSPQLLMLSGIGPKEHLKSMNIEVIADLPVGHHLQDHPVVANINAIIRDNVTVNTMPELNVNQLYELFTNGSGPLSRRTQSLFVYYSTRSNEEKDWPDICYAFGLITIDWKYLSQFMHRINEWKDYFRPYLGQNVLQLSSQLSRLRSYGSLRLVSNNPFVYPLIDPKFLSDQQDFEAMFYSLKFLFYYLSQTSISQYVYPIPEPIPDCQFCSSGQIYECDSYIRCLIRQLGTKGFHPVGTCRMGSVDRNDVVVDPSLQVLGICALRVCDASVMPQIINANTNAASIMIGEKCSDYIKSDQKLNKHF